MEWHVIQNEDDVELLMRKAEDFHDWYVAGFTYNSLARAEDDSLSLGRFIEDTDSLLLTLRYDSKDANGIYPEIEFEFFDVHDMTFGNWKSPDPLWECSMEKVGQFWVLVAENPLTDEERNDLYQVKSVLFVCAREIKWRNTKGILSGEDV